MKIDKDKLEQAMNNAVANYTGQGANHARTISESKGVMEYLEMTKATLAPELFSGLMTMFHLGFEAGIEYQKLTEQPQSTTTASN